MDRGNVAFAAFGGVEPAGAADIERLDRDPPDLQPADTAVEGRHVDMVLRGPPGGSPNRDALIRLGSGSPNAMPRTPRSPSRRTPPPRDSNELQPTDRRSGRFVGSKQSLCWTFGNCAKERPPSS